ncbi:MAG: hypothetical protein Q4B22_11930 [Eubacteriales bacterium]|nr:hypothetical protein [Eubacteriales bacterium]
MMKRKVISLILAAVITVTGWSMGTRTAEADSADTVSMYRMYNPNSGEHFYTGNEGEKESLLNAGWWCEGTGWVGPRSSKKPVYRLYNPNAGDHHYTTSAGERDYLKTVGWKYEGIGWYSSKEGTMPVYREYNPNATTGAHNYTTSAGEDAMLVNAGWKQEGIGWYALKAGKSYERPEVKEFTEDLSGDIVAMDFLSRFSLVNYSDVVNYLGQPSSYRGPEKVWYGNFYRTYSYADYSNINFGGFKGTLHFVFGSQLACTRAYWTLDDPSQYAEANARLRGGFRKHSTAINEMWGDNENYVYNENYRGGFVFFRNDNGTLTVLGSYAE